MRDMKHRRRYIAAVVTFWFVVLGVPGFIVYREARQQDLNRRLIKAIGARDTHAVVRALEQGASANARDQHAIPPWALMRNLLLGDRSAETDSASALMIAVGVRKGCLHPQHHQCKTLNVGVKREQAFTSASVAAVFAFIRLHLRDLRIGSSPPRG
jgi:hypothetical protein